MIRKIFEALFRHKFLLLLPPILIPAIVTPIAFLTTPPVYETSVGVWVDRPAYLEYKDGAAGWVSGVQSQAGRMNELLRTRSFLVDVAGRTSLAPLMATSAGEARVADLIGRSVSIGGVGTGASTFGGDHLLLIRVQAPTAQVSYELSKAIVDAYGEKMQLDQEDQASVAVDFYQSRVVEAQKQLSKVSQDLRRYATTRASNGSLGLGESSTSSTDLPAAMLDPRLASLQSAVQAAQADVNSSQAALTESQKSAMAAAQGQQYGFQVLDEPRLPTAATSQIKKLIVYPIAAVVAGLGLSGMLLVLLVISDRSVRSEYEISPGVRVLGVVPNLQLKRVPRKLRNAATRRAIGAPAGAALPAPGGAR